VDFSQVGCPDLPEAFIVSRFAPAASGSGIPEVGWSWGRNWESRGAAAKNATVKIKEVQAM